MGHDELADIVELERSLLDPVVRADRSRLRGLLHQEFVEFGASGRTWAVAELVDELAADPGLAGTASDFASVRLAEDVVLLTYRFDAPERSSLRSSVWLRDTDGQWRLRFHQGTATAGPAG